ncbi:DUF3850 domain-containing protein [Tenacibaculum agarivorans]|uniref:DUF3850 domain-containing protein n=1 Tax=Tenacibaculum agarivorans TaxID=1908389 RepID=UPI0009F986DF|nr:DUF3850 domain-containing protein [Tenacibaculum agarivorans]
MKHYLKIFTEHFEEVHNGNKKAEIRFNDRDFKVGDILILQEFNHNSNSYTGRSTTKKITHILEDIDGEFGISDGYVLLSIK